MLISEALEYAEQQMDKWLEYPKQALTGKRVWTVKLDNAVRRFGSCDGSKKQITLSRKLIEMNSEEHVKDVVLHEIAHALSSDYAHHNNEWKQNCRLVGAKPERTYDHTVNQPKPVYKVSCNNGHQHTRYRKLNVNRYRCRCGSSLVVKKI